MLQNTQNVSRGMQKIIHLSQKHVQHAQNRTHTQTYRKGHKYNGIPAEGSLYTQTNIPSNALGGTHITSASTSPAPPCAISQTLISYQSSTEKFTLVHANTEWLSSLL